MNQALSQHEEEKRNRIKALIYTILINGFLFFIFYTVNIWSGEEFKMDMPSGGFEVNYGNSDIGGGNIQSKNQSNELLNENDSKPTEKVTPVEKEIVKANKEEATLITSKLKSPVKIESKPVEKKVEPSKVVKKEIIPAEVTPKIDENALFKKKSTSNGTKGTNANSGGNSNGTDVGKIGDKGQLNGEINNSAIYKGNKGNNGGSNNGLGGGNGISVNLTGWTLASRPQVNDDSDETGIIRFSIKIDENGSIISLKIVETTLSASVAQKYKRAIEKLSFKPTSTGERPEVSTGSIMFKINSK
jgi:outer membrane biosynthesis protein TonB